jgi:hypothetical protein
MTGRATGALRSRPQRVQCSGSTEMMEHTSSADCDAAPAALAARA